LLGAFKVVREMRFYTFNFGDVIAMGTGSLRVLVVLLLFYSHNVQAQEDPLPRVHKPSWVKTTPLPNMLFEKAKDSTANFIIYSEEQVNYLTGEIYERTVCRVLAGKDEVRPFSFSRTYNPADDSLMLIGFKWTRAGQVRNQWDRSSDNLEEYQINQGLFHSVRKVQLIGNSSIDGDFFEIEFLVKNLREDIDHLAIPEYGFDRGTYNYVRVISPSRLNTVEIQGVSAPKIDSAGNQFEYVWQGLGIYNKTENNPSWRYMGSRLSASPFDNNKELLQWKMPLYELDEPSKIAVKRKQKALTQGLSDLETKIVNILNYVQDSITYQEYGLYAPRMPDRTIADGYGDCKSKSLLGVELLKETGVQAWPIMVNMRGYEEQFHGFASPQKFDHCVIQYVHNSDTFTIDATTHGQGDRLGMQYHEPFKRGLRVEQGEAREVFIRPAEASTIDVRDVYRATDHSITRKVIATGKEADRLRKVYAYHGLKGLHKVVEYKSEPETGYTRTLDLGYNYRCYWNRQGPVGFKDWNSKDANQVAIVIFYALNKNIHEHFVGFDLEHFRALIREYPIAEEIERVGFIEPISITHTLTLTANDIRSVCGDSLVDTTVSLRVGSDVPIYHNQTAVYDDSVVFEQEFHIPSTVSLEEAREFNALMEEIESERTRMRELPKRFNSLLPEDPFQSDWLSRIAAAVGGILLSLFLLAFFVLGLVHLVKGKRRKKRFRKIRLLRNSVAAVTACIVLTGISEAQTISLTKVPTWTDVYTPDSSLTGSDPIQIVQKELQVNDLTREVFYRNTYEVNRKGAPHTCFLSITYDALVDTVELMTFHVERNGRQLSMMPGLIQRNRRKVTNADGLVLKNNVSLYFHNDLFENRDLVTVAYVKKPKKGYLSSLSEYDFEAGAEGVACRYVFSVISKPSTLKEKHFQGFGSPKVISVQGTEKWLWDQVFELKKQDIFFTEPKTPSWYNEKPHIHIFSSKTESELAMEVMQMPRFVFENKALVLLLKSCGWNTTVPIHEQVCTIDRYIRDSLVEYEMALMNEQLGYARLVKSRSADGYTKAMLFSKALLLLGIENDLLLVRKGGIDTSHAQVLSTRLFSHAIVRYQIEGRACYFDPVFEGVGKHLGHYRKFHYQYGLNLTSPTSKEELCTIPRVFRNQLLIQDTIQHSGKLERWMFFEGDLASDLRDGYYAEDFPFKKRVTEGWGMNNVFPSDVFRLQIPVSEGDVDSFVYQDTEDGGVNLYLSFDVNRGDSIDAKDGTDHFRQFDLCDELKTLYSDDDLDKYNMVRRAEIEIRHTVTIPDQVLLDLSVPDIHLEAPTATFKRSSFSSKGLFTLDLWYTSTADFMTMDLYDAQFYFDLIYHAVPDDTLDPESLMGYQRSLERQSRLKLDEYLSYLGLVLMLLALSIVLFGLYKTIQVYRKRQKRRARLKRLTSQS